MQREWREAIDMRSSSVALGLVVAAAAALRLWSLGAGHVTAAEHAVADAVMQLLRAGSYHPPVLTQPTLPVYLQAALAVVQFLAGATTGAWRSVSDFGSAQVLAWGRVLSALIGTAVVIVVYQVGMRWGSRHALLAAGLIAVTPMHVEASRAITGGSLLTFCAALTLLLSIAATERHTRRAFVWAGAASGFAAACHFAGGLTLVLPIAAAWMTVTDQSTRAGRVASAAAAAIVAFVAATPLALRDLPAFLNGFAEAAAPVAGSGGPIDLSAQLVGTLQWPGVVLAVAGIALGITRAITGPGHTRWTLLVGFPVIYFAASAWHGGTSDAVMLPALPAIVLLAAIAVVSGVSQLRRFEIPRAARTGMIAALTVLAVLPPAVLSIALVRQAARDARGSGIAQRSGR